MTRYAVLGIRLVLVLFFLIGMPILALPPVADWCEAHLYAPAAKRRVITARQPAHTAKPGERTELPWIEQVSYAEPIAPPQAAESRPEDLNALASTVQALGATFYRLEELPEPTPQYRFTAQVQTQGPVPQRASYSATAPTAVAAIQTVIDQIRAGR